MVSKTSVPVMGPEGLARTYVIVFTIHHHRVIRCQINPKQTLFLQDLFDYYLTSNLFPTGFQNYFFGAILLQ